MRFIEFYKSNSTQVAKPLSLTLSICAGPIGPRGNTFSKETKEEGCKKK
jgi:hypothetical protein